MISDPIIALIDVEKRLSDTGLLRESYGGSLNQSISRITTDSKNAGSDSAFIAYVGVHQDSHQFIEGAYAQGCRVFVVERIPPSIRDDCTYLHVSNGRSAWSELAALLSHDTHQKVKSLAVTGTNGKTSTVWYIREILRLCGISTMGAGTLGIYFDDHKYAECLTTPDPDQLFSAISTAVSRQIPIMALEASSHAMHQKRLGPLRFAGAIFTSFSRDHLDFHETMDEYFEAKAELFYTHIQEGAPILLHHSLGRSLDLARVNGEVFRYGRAQSKEIDLTYDFKEATAVGSQLTLKSPGSCQTGMVPLFAEFSIANFAAAYFLVEAAIGIALPAALWADVKQVPGRMELIKKASPDQPHIFVDYAHTPDALEKALSTLRCVTKGDLWVVFGCGGDRDQGKRPLMAAAAESQADKIVITSDNPRFESPTKIIEEILAGIQDSGKIEAAIPSRAEALQFAIQQAKAEDVVLVAGKGHEDYQIIGDKKEPFDDRSVVASLLGGV